MKNGATIFFALLTLLGCSSKEGVYIFNPHLDTMQLSLNEINISVGNNKLLKIDLDPGIYEVTSKLDDSILVESKIEISETLIKMGVMINLSDQPMFLWKEKYQDKNRVKWEAYFDEGKTAAEIATEDAYWDSLVDVRLKEEGYDVVEKKKPNIVFIDSFVLVGNIKEYPAEKLLIPKEWDVNIISPFPDEINTYEMEEQIFGKTLSKIFCKHDMIQYYKFGTFL